MLKKVIRPAAERDLNKIWQYTYETWGRDQARYYLMKIDGFIDQLIEHPGLGRSREDIRVGYASFQVEHHTVFYTVENDALVVQRVLHKNMDTERHL